MRRETILAATLGLTLAACGDASRGGALDNSASNRSTTSFADYDAGSVSGGPGAHKLYALGRPASDSLVTVMNHDVGADGAELPAGSGTVAEGAALFATQCAQCHGKKGEGMAPSNPRLIGRDPNAEQFAFATNPKLVHTIGNYWPYATTLFDYIKRSMPLLAPGTLTDDQAYALTAYLLAANAVIADSTTLNAAALRKVRMPYQDRFVPDDRKPAPVAK